MNFMQKTLLSLETWVSINNNLCGKLISSIESRTPFGERFTVTSLFFFFLILNY